jgi:hypothetical protein
MPCLIALFALLSPRLAIILMWLFGDLLGRAFDSAIVPILGFFLLPWTVVGYAIFWDVGSRGVTGFEWFFVVLCFLLDLGSYGGGARARG